VVWLRRKDVVTPEPAPAVVPRPAVRRLPLCGPGTEVTVLMDTPSHEGGAMFHARVGLTDGDRIMLANTAGIQPDDETRVTLRWAIDFGECSVGVTVQDTDESTWTVQADGEVVHRQRRGWVRVATAVAVRIRGHYEESWQAGETLNLSAGGMAAVFDVIPDEAPVAGQEIDIELGLLGGLAVTGTVVHIGEHETGHILRASFADVPEATRERLAAQVFRLQREKLARDRLHDEGLAMDAAAHRGRQAGPAAPGRRRTHEPRSGR
jgi:PilZ domain